MADRRHEALAELTAVYALDALEAEEAEVVARHLDECPRCRTEVESFRETAALLAHTGVDAPAGLWQRVVDALEEAPAVAPMFPMGRPAPRKPRSLLIGALAAAAALIVVVPTVALVVRQNNKIDQITAVAKQQVNLERVALAAAADPLARKVHLRSSTTKWTGEAVILPDGRGYLIRHDLPELDAGHTYQLWGRHAGVDKPISLGVLGTAPKVVAFAATSPLVRIGISVEPAGGSPAPSGGTGVMGGDVPAQEQAT